VAGAVKQLMPGESIQLTEDAFPLRADHLQALREQLTLHGSRKVARMISPGQIAWQELEVIDGGQPPNGKARTAIIKWLVASQLVQRLPGQPRDPYQPDGTEVHTPATKRAAARRERENR